MPGVTDPWELDAFAAAAWPAAEAVERDGWLLRSTPGTRGRRLNSALPLRPDVGPPSVPLAQVTPLERLGPLDATLAGAGWVAEAPTDVLVAEAPAVAAIASGTGVDVERVSVSSFRAAWTTLGTRSRSGGDGEDDVLGRIGFELLPLVARVDGVLAGIALGVLSERWSIAFEVATDPRVRRRGVATALMRAWAEAAGDRGLVLQVMTDNAPALALYAALGFTRSHGYHYRRAPA